MNYAEYGSINVIGLNRMGKSSLVYNTLEAKAKDFYGIWGDDGMSTDEFIDLIKSERVFHREIAEL